MKERKYVREFCTEHGARQLLEIIEENSPYKGAFRIEKSDLGLFVIRSNLLRGLPRDKDIQDPRRHIQSTPDARTRYNAGRKIHEGGT